MWLLAACLLSVVPSDLAPQRSATVDVIEINTVYRINGGEVDISFVQLIFWRRHPWGRSSYLQCCGFRVWGANTKWRVHSDGVSWTKSGCRCRVVATTIVTTWTTGDPEMDDRRRCKIKHRQSLWAQK